eukprot:scaffold82952_cov39-Phaeocystis_antarctica.AAC.1
MILRVYSSVLAKDEHDIDSLGRTARLWKLHSTKDDLLTPQWAREMTVTRPYFFYTGTDAPFRPSHTSQRSAQGL